MTTHPFFFFVFPSLFIKRGQSSLHDVLDGRESIAGILGFRATKEPVLYTPNSAFFDKSRRKM